MDDTEVVLEVDGNNIPMNGFVKKILFGMVKGSIEALHGIGSDWKTINISLKR